LTKEVRESLNSNDVRESLMKTPVKNSKLSLKKVVQDEIKNSLVSAGSAEQLHETFMLPS